MLRLISIFICTPLLLFSQAPIKMGGGEHKIEQDSPCISGHVRTQVKSDIKRNITDLETRENLADSKNQTNPSFSFPLSMEDNDLYINYYGIANYVDHDPVATGSQYGSSNLDYFCGNRSYDTNTGYNHQGIDFSTWPFAWHMFENDVVNAIAAAGGVIVAKYDGNFDQNCSCVNSQSNSIHIEHSDGSQSWYWHLKENSLTAKQIGDPVQRGEFLGVIGSSGCSTAPHLHFEVYDAAGNLIDPYAGSCNSLNTESWWIDQQAYTNPTLNAVLTHSEEPTFGCTSTEEQPHFKNCFNPGQDIYMAYYYRDQPANENTQISIIQPDGNIYAQWNHSSSEFYLFSYWYWVFTPPADAPQGTWMISGEFNGSLHTYSFYYGDNDCTCPIEYSAVNSNKLIGNINSDIVYEAHGRIESIQQILGGATVVYDSGTQVILGETFEVRAGVTFTALIDGCGGI